MGPGRTLRGYERPRQALVRLGLFGVRVWEVATKEGIESDRSPSSYCVTSGCGVLLADGLLQATGTG